ncbi:hypothetical protein HIM_04241 [Hirsutella minnesotensis 3608]|uniref:Uncharacterized protein n=1 Tax=Hirsutella minnesotensis 3608 TaxID=1043627 RepID=A0A0F8A1U1_9HYPO|nr:hypothetical protein HIM_04241 [Hirsutella minnesotensis 3608]
MQSAPGTNKPLSTWLFHALLALLVSPVISAAIGQGRDLEPRQESDKIVTGVYGSYGYVFQGERFTRWSLSSKWTVREKPKILVHDRQGTVSWSWDYTVGLLNRVPNEPRKCIGSGISATEAKFAKNGSKIVAIIGRSAVIINYAPGSPADKMVEYAVCLEGILATAHTVELLPGNLLAIATSGQTADDGVWIYDGNQMSPDPRPVQTLLGVRAVHGMIWDQESQKLWVAGNTDAADGSGGTSYGIVQGYAYNEQAQPKFRESDAFKMAEAKKLASEWTGSSSPEFANWWDGAHDLVPVPSKRILLVPMDVDIYSLDISTGAFNRAGDQVASEFLKGFRPVDTRIGDNQENLPRSDIKSLNLHPDGSALYTQAPWRESSGLAKQVNLLNMSQGYSVPLSASSIYRSRWFMEIPGWQTA